MALPWLSHSAQLLAGLNFFNFTAFYSRSLLSVRVATPPVVILNVTGLDLQRNHF